MADTIIITKLANGNVLVDSSTILNTFNPDAQCYKVEDSVQIKDKSGSKITTFNTVDILKVIHDDGVEVIINDVDTLFLELITFFFFKLAGGGSGSGTGWSGQVEFRADLPITIGSPTIGDIYLVEQPTKILLGAYTTYQSGLYIRDFNTGALSDWRKLNVKVKFTDSEFAIVNAADESKQAKFDLSLVTTSTTRTYNYPDKNGTIALLSDISGGGGPSLRNITASDTFVTASETLNCQSGTFTANLPTAVGIQGVTYTLVNSGTGIITLDADGTETINGSLTIEIKRQHLSRTVQSDGANWIVI